MNKTILFQPTLPARGATRQIRQVAPTVFLFQPTLPARGATDAPVAPVLTLLQHFNPRSPHGERPERA